VTTTCATVATYSADYVTFTRDPGSDVYIPDFGSNFDNFTKKFMTRDDRRFESACRPSVPGFDVQVGATDSSSQHPNFDLVIAWLRFGAFG